MNIPLNKTEAFEKINPKVKYCIKDTETKNYLLGNEAVSVCSESYYKERNFKIDIFNKACVDSCLIGLYEYNNIWNDKCLKGTILKDNLCEDNCCLQNNLIYKCHGETPVGYFFESRD